MQRFLLPGVAFALVTSHVIAAGNPMETIVVSGSRSHTARGLIPADVTIIDSDDIRHSGARNLAAVLRSSGMVQVSDLFGDGTDSSIGLRGFTETAQHNTLIMVDGRRLNNIDDGLPDLNTIALQHIDRIEIINGSQGALYGDKAVGGIINIITRDPESMELQGRAVYGSYDRRGLSVSLENRHDSGVFYRAGGVRTLNSNYRDNNELQLTDVSLEAGWETTAGGARVEYQDINEDLELPGALFADLVADDRRQSLNSGDFSNTDTRVLRVSLHGRPADWLDARVEYTNRLSDTRGRISSGGAPSSFTLTRHHIEFTPRLAARFNLPAGEARLTLGADLFDTDYRLSSDFGITDDTQTRQSIYLHALIPVSDTVSMTLGGRHGRVRNDILVDTLAFGRSLPEGSELNDSANAFEAGLIYRPAGGWRLYGRIAGNYRFVSADEYSAVADNNFFAGLFSFGQAVPLPETQTGVSWEFGGEWSGENASASVSAWQLELDDEIVFDPVLFLNTNIGNTRRRGLSFRGDHRFNQHWRVAARYSFIETEVTSGPFSGSDLTFVPAHTASLIGEYRYNEAFSGYLEILGTSSRTFGGDFANTHPELPGHVIGNLNLNYRIRSFRFSLRVNNLLDTEYSDAGNLGFDFRTPSSPRVRTFYPAPGRNFLLTLEYRYQ